MKKTLIAATLLLTLTACAGTRAPADTAQSPSGNSNQAASQAAGETPAASAPTIQTVQAQVSSIDSSVEVHYRCTSPSGNQRVSAMYGIKDGTIVVAQLKIGEQVSPGLWRVVNDANGESQNSFYGEGLTWLTQKATPATLRRTLPIQLLQAKTLDANGTPTGPQDILLKDCSLAQQAATRNTRNRRR